MGEIKTEACPRLAAETREAMAADALRILVDSADCLPADLRLRYGWTMSQIDAHAEAAIAAARRVWESWDRPAVMPPAVTAYVAGGNGAAIPIRRNTHDHDN